MSGASSGQFAFSLRLAALLFNITPTPVSIIAQNMVPNPGFEETDSCTFGLGLGALNHWYSAFLTPDHLQHCLAYGAVNGLPLNTFTYQEPYEGGACVGLYTYHKNGLDEQREWVMVPLVQPMIIGQTYYCSFRANAGFGGNAEYPLIWLGSNNIGMHFTTTDREWNWGDPYPAMLDEAHVRRTEVLTDTVGWTLVSGSFVADSAYSHLMIGNFFRNALTDTIHFAPEGDPWEWFPRGYSLVDAVCVSANLSSCDLVQSVALESSEGVRVHPRPANKVVFIEGAVGADYIILDALGRVVERGRVSNDRWPLEVSAWPRGSYLIRLDKAGKMDIEKFVLAD